MIRIRIEMVWIRNTLKYTLTGSNWTLNLLIAGVVDLPVLRKLKGQVLTLPHPDT
jgi:hypothetical protein